MARSRYWKLTSDEMSGFNYDESKLLNWEIKCIREPEDEAHFIGVFMYKNGTAYDYESVKGICYFYNNIDREELPKITSFLQGNLMGNRWKKEIGFCLKILKKSTPAKTLGIWQKKWKQSSIHEQLFL